MSGEKMTRKNVLILEIKEGKSDDPGNCDPTKWNVVFS